MSGPPTPTTLTALHARNLACTACDLRAGATRVIVAEGPLDAPLALIGEAPGRHEDQQGRPFVGPAGQLLDRILHAAGIARQDTYLTNTVKCRPPAGDPLPQERLTCANLWLEPQLQLLHPRIVVTLGNVPTQATLRTTRGVSELRGHWYQLPPTAGNGAAPPILVRPIFHPAYLLRREERTPGSPRSLTWLDIQEVAAVLNGRAVPEAPIPVPLEDPAQPTLF